MKVLVIGASGFVGARTCLHLTEVGHTVIRVFHNNAGRTLSDTDHVADISDPTAFSALEGIAGIDAIVNCAGIAHRFGKTSQKEFYEVNVRGVRNIAEFAVRKGVGQLIHLSSVMVYGTSLTEVPVTEEHPLSSGDLYSQSKLEGEIVATEVCSKAKVRLVILRPTPIMGEGSRGNVARLIKSIDRGRFVWIGDGLNRRSFVYVGDVARAINATLDSGTEHAIFNVTGEIITVRELVDTIADRLGKNVWAPVFPNSMAHLGLKLLEQASIFPPAARYHRMLDTWLSSAVYSGEAFAAHGFAASISVEEALAKEIDHYIDNR